MFDPPEKATKINDLVYFLRGEFVLDLDDNCAMNFLRILDQIIAVSVASQCDKIS